MTRKRERRVGGARIRRQKKVTTDKQKGSIQHAPLSHSGLVEEKNERKKKNVASSYNDDRGRIAFAFMSKIAPCMRAEEREKKLVVCRRRKKRRSKRTKKSPTRHFFFYPCFFFSFVFSKYLATMLMIIIKYSLGSLYRCILPHSSLPN